MYLWRAIRIDANYCRGGHVFCAGERREQAKKIQRHNSDSRTRHRSQHSSLSDGETVRGNGAGRCGRRRRRTKCVITNMDLASSRAAFFQHEWTGAQLDKAGDHPYLSAFGGPSTFAGASEGPPLAGPVRYIAPNYTSATDHRNRKFYTFYYALTRNYITDTNRLKTTGHDARNNIPSLFFPPLYQDLEGLGFAENVAILCYL